MLLEFRAGWRGKGKSSHEEGLNLFSGGETGPRELRALNERRCSVNEYLLQAKGKRQNSKMSR